MAAAIDGGPPPNGLASDASAAANVGIRKIEISDVMDCIGKGAQDFSRTAKYGLAFGVFYAIGGLLIVGSSLALDYPYLVYPFIMGFALFAPFGAAGTYEISRRLESGEPLSWSAVLGVVWNRAGKELAWLGLVSVFTVIIWLYIAALIFLTFYGSNIPSISPLVADVFTTPRGMTFFMVGNAVGAVIALVVFAFTAFSPPLVVDRDMDFVTAMATSWRAVSANPPAMLAWAVVIGADLAISFVTVFVAMLVVFPVLGHTTWHLYRRVIA